MQLIEGMLWLVEDTQKLLCPNFRDFLIQIRACGFCPLQPTVPCCQPSIILCMQKETLPVDAPPTACHAVTSNAPDRHASVLLPLLHARTIAGGA